MSVANPFFNRNSIAHPSYFYNRTETVSKVLDLLYKGVSVMLTGPRRIGRSSFLRYLCTPSVQEQYGYDENKQRPFIYVDCTLCHLQSSEVFYKTIWKHLETKLGIAPFGSTTQFDTSASIREHFVKCVFDAFEQVGSFVILFDEFDSVYANPYIDGTDFEVLRSLNTQGWVSFCSALTTLDTAFTERPSPSRTAAFANMAIHESLGLFSAWDARQMIRDLMQINGEEFSPTVVDHLIENLAGPHPYLLQIAAYEAYELRVSLTLEDYGIASEAIRELDRRYLSQARYFWDTLWDKLTEGDKRACALLSVANIQPQLEQALRLERLGLFRRDNQGLWQPISRILASFVFNQRLPNLIMLRCNAAQGSKEIVYLLLDLERETAFLDGRRLALSSIPFQVLRYLAERPNEIVKVVDIEAHVYPGERFYSGSEDRIKPQVRAIRDALGNNDLLQNRRGLGYILMTQ